jgi:hypothetical protein
MDNNMDMTSLTTSLPYDMTSSSMIDVLLDRYPQVMHVKLWVDPYVEGLADSYDLLISTHHAKIAKDPFYIDAGFDLLCPGNLDEGLSQLHGDSVPLRTDRPNKMDFAVAASATLVQGISTPMNRHGEMNLIGKRVYPSGYLLYPRSSLGKGPMRLANSVGVIDAGYRGNLCGLFDVIENEKDIYFARKGERYVQLCAPGLQPIVVERVLSKHLLSEPTSRGAGGFGSTGV